MSSSGRWAEETARIIVESRSLYARAHGEPFFYSSGWASPLYIDCKKLISSPADRNALVEIMIEQLSTSLDLDALEVVAGCELSGIPFATLVADRLSKPLVLVRRQSKGFGRLAHFEGEFEPGAKVLLIDDLATDGMSEAVFLNALEQAEANVMETFALIDFDVFPTAHSHVSLAKLRDIVDCARKDQYFGLPTLEEVEKFIEDPAHWSRQHGGIAGL